MLDLGGWSSLLKFVFNEYGIKNMILHTENSFLSLLFIMLEKTRYAVSGKVNTAYWARFLGVRATFLINQSRSTKTSDGLAAIQAQLNNLGKEIKKVNEKVYAAQVGCEQCKGPHYTKDYPLKKEGKTLEESYHAQFGRPFQRGGYRAAALGFYQRNNVNPSYQERWQSMEDTLRKCMSESAKRHEKNYNFIKEIRASTDAAIRNQGASIKTLEIQIRQMSK
ncbi:hypothetical protein Tco_1308273, partial [Tanacetum coccineum]